MTLMMKPSTSNIQIASGLMIAHPVYGAALRRLLKKEAASENLSMPLPFTPTEDTKSVQNREVLVVGSDRYFGPTFEDKDLVYAGSNISAMSWLSRNRHLIDEIWLDFEIPFDSWELAERSVVRPIGGFENEARIFIQFLEEDHFKTKETVKRVRVITHNPAGILYIRQALKDYELCFTYPTTKDSEPS